MKRAPSPESRPGRLVISPNCCWPRGQRFTGSSGALRRSTPADRSPSYVDPHQPGAAVSHHGDLIDGTRLVTLLEHHRTRRGVHLAAQSHVRVSFRFVTPCTPVTPPAWDPCGLLEAAPALWVHRRFYQASVGDVRRLAATAERADAVLPAVTAWRRQGLFVLGDRNYREAYGLFAVNGICSITNHRGAVRRS